MRPAITSEKHGEAAVEWHFVGRTRLVETIRSALRRGNPGAIVVSGEPGSGRTALVARVLGLPEAAGLVAVDDAHLRDPGSLRALPGASLLTTLPGRLPAGLGALHLALPPFTV
ncbi:MAG: ATP-binding protein, partial [Nonomuraea sp.]|nr:ATP-binding protein [Nonomuraea sp.]